MNINNIDDNIHPHEAFRPRAHLSLCRRLGASSILVNGMMHHHPFSLEIIRAMHFEFKFEECYLRLL